MEAVPRLPMLSFELKVSPENTEFGSKLSKYIHDVYHEDPDSYAKEIKDLEALRVAAIHVTRDYTGCSTLKRYYSQLCLLQRRFHMTDDGAACVPFMWCDIYSGMIFNITDITYEQACILYNIGALHSELGASDRRQTSEGMKISCTHFQCATWAFQYLRDNFPQPKGSDMAHDLLTFFINIMLAQAQECILEKSMLDNRKSTIIAKVAAQIVDYYKQAQKTLEMGRKSMESGCVADIVGSKLFKSWQRYLLFKMSYHSCITFLYLGNQAEELQKMGERTAYYQAALEKLNEATKQAKGLDKDEISETLVFTMDVVGGKYEAAKKENEFIYHEKVPEIESLPALKGASLVKGIPFDPNDPEIAGMDIFARLIPMAAHEVSSLYSEEKAKLLRKIGTDVEEKNQELETYLLSLQLDQLNLNPTPEQLPQELIECCAALSVKPNIIKDLIDSMQSLSSLYHDVECNLQELQDVLNEEAESEKKYQGMVGKRGPNMILLDIQKEFTKYQEAHAKAKESNNSLHRAMNVHLQNLRLLSLPLDEIQKSLPSTSSIDTSKDDETVSKLKLLIGKVDEMKNQRHMLETHIRNDIQADDIMPQLVRSEASSQEEIFNQELKKHEKTIRLLEQNLLAQDNILKALTEANAQYADTRRVTNEIGQRRNNMLRALVASFEAYEDLLAKSQKGHEFYRKLETNVLKLLQRTRSVCKVHDEERQQIMNKSKPKAAASKTTTSGPKLKDYLQYMQPGFSTVGLPTSVQDPSYSNIPPQLIPGSEDVTKQVPGPSLDTGVVERMYMPRPAPVGSEQADLLPAQCSSMQRKVDPPTPSLQQHYPPTQSAYETYPDSTFMYQVAQYGANVYNQSVAAQYPAATQYERQNYYVPANYPSMNVPSPSPASGTFQETMVPPIQTPQSSVRETQVAPNQTFNTSNQIPRTEPYGTQMYFPQYAAVVPGTVMNQYIPPQNVPSPVPIATPTTSGGAYGATSESYYPNFGYDYYSAAQAATYPPSSDPSYMTAMNYPVQYNYVVEPSAFTRDLTNVTQPGANPNGYLQYTQAGLGTAETTLSSGYMQFSNPASYVQQQVHRPDSQYYTSSGLIQPHSYMSGSESSNYNQPTIPANGANAVSPNVQSTSTTVPAASPQQSGNEEPRLSAGLDVSLSYYGTNHVQPTALSFPSQNYAAQQILTPVPATHSNIAAQVPQPDASVSQIKHSTTTTTTSTSVSTTSVPSSNLQLLQQMQVNTGEPSASKLGSNGIPIVTSKPPTSATSTATTPASSNTVTSAPRKDSLTNGTLQTFDPFQKQTNGNQDPVRAKSPEQESQAEKDTKDSQRIPKDPYLEQEVLNRFIADVERFEKTVEGLTKQSLNGPTPLDQKWKELVDAQDRESRKLVISIARCYSMKNRLADVMPYDVSRVRLTTTRDDYINGSYIKELSRSPLQIIATQAPLPSTMADFWLMIFEQQCEIIVCLMSDLEMKNHIYWPQEKNHNVVFESLSISLEGIKTKPWGVERVFVVTQTQMRLTRVVIHLQCTMWPPSENPSNMCHYVQLVSDTLSYHQQQRNLNRPLVVHCSAGIGRTGVFCLTAAAALDITTGRGILQVTSTAARMMQMRKSLLQDKDQLRFCYEAILYYARDLLMKRGILSSKPTFEDKLAVTAKSGHTRHPSEDFILGIGDISKLKSDVKTTTDDKKSDSGDSASRKTSCQANKDDDNHSTGSGPSEGILSRSNSIASVGSSASLGSFPTDSPQHVGGKGTLPASLAKLDATNFTLEPLTAKSKRKITRESFLNPTSKLSSTEKDPDDPLSQLDPLWTHKRDSQT